MSHNLSTFNHDNLKITTMTMIFMLETNINIKDAFYLLPIEKVNFQYNKKQAKIKLPLCNKGSILSMKYPEVTRGIIRNTKFFKNAVSIVISTSIKNINVKLIPNKLQLCGATSIENGIEAATLIMTHLHDIKSYIDYLRENANEFQQMLQWIYTNMKGEPTIKTFQKMTKYDNKFILNVIHEIDDFTIIPPMMIPYEFHPDAMHYMISLANDQTYFNDYYNKIRNLLNFHVLYDTEEIKISRMYEAMVNYNYNLGYKINRDKLHLLIDGINGFSSNYDNALVNNVTIELQYECNFMVKKNTKVPHHTFLVYHSGAVTQSGPNIKLCKEAYLLFRRTIDDMKDEIMFVD